MKRILVISVLISVLTIAVGELSVVGHHGPINSVAISIDGRIAVTGGGWPDPVMRIWNLRAGELLKIIPFEGYVGAVAISQDGRFIAGGGKNGIIYVWDLRENRWVNTFVGHTSPVVAMTFDPSGKYLASGDKSGTVKVWKVGRVGPYKNFFAHDSAVTDLSFSSSGEYLISASLDGKVKIWDYFYRDPIVEIDVGKPVTCAVVIPPKYTYEGDMTVVTGDKAGNLTFWRIRLKRREGEFIGSFDILGSKTIKAHEGSVTALVLNEDETILVSGGYDGEIKLWDPVKEDMLKKVGKMSRPVTSLAMTLDGRVLASDVGGNMIFWRSNTGTVLRVFEGSPMIESLDSEGDITAVGYVDGSVKIFDGWGKPIGIFTDHDLSVHVGLVGNKLISAGEDGRLIIRYGESWKDENVLMRRSSPFKILTKGEKFAVTIDDKGNMKVWDVMNQEIYSLIVAGNGITSAVVDEKNKRLITGDSKGYVSVWDIDAGVMISNFRLGFVEIRDLEISRDGEYIAVAGDDGYVRILDSESLTEIARFKPLMTCVEDMAFLDSPYVLALVGSEETVEIWNWGLKEIENVMIVENDVLARVDYNSTKHVIVAGGYKGKIYVWDVRGNLIRTFIAFADGEYAVESGGRVVVSDGIRSGKVMGLNFGEVSLEESTEKKECGVRNGEELRMVYKQRGNALEMLAVSKSSIFLASGDEISSWNVENGNLKSLFHLKSDISSIFSSDTGDLVVGTEDGKVYVLRTTDRVPMEVGKHFGKIYGVGWSDHLGCPVSIGADDYMIVWRDEPLRINVEQPYFLKIIGNGERAVVGCRDGYLRVYDLEDGTKIASIKAHDDYVIFVGTSDNLLVSVGWDDRIRLWNLKTLKQVEEFDIKYPIVYKTLALNNGELAFVNYRGELEIRDLRSNSVKLLINVGESVSDVEFHGDYVVTVSDIGTVSVYNVKTAEKVSELFVKDGGYIAYTKDGKYISRGIKPDDVMKPVVIGSDGKKEISFSDLCNVESLKVFPEE